MCQICVFFFYFKKLSDCRWNSVYKQGFDWPFFGAFWLGNLFLEKNEKLVFAWRKLYSSGWQDLSAVFTFFLANQ